MLFKDTQFKFVAENVIDLCRYPIALVGGAVRDEVNGRVIKDFDILVHEEHLVGVNAFFESIGLELLITRDDIEDGATYGELPDDFDSRYTDWQHWEGLNNEYIHIDLLVLGKDKYPIKQSALNFMDAVRLFDNTMNMWIYYAGTIGFLGGQGYLTDNAKQAIQVRVVSPERVAHVQDIANELGWTYVPFGAE